MTEELYECIGAIDQVLPELLENFPQEKAPSVKVQSSPVP